MGRTVGEGVGSPGCINNGDNVGLPVAFVGSGVGEPAVNVGLAVGVTVGGAFQHCDFV